MPARVIRRLPPLVGGVEHKRVHEAAPDATLYDSEGDPIVYREKSMLAMLVKAVQDIDQRLGALE